MNEESTPVIYMATVSAPVNIACIKYWGKASIPLNTPINDSVSVTLDQSDLRAVTTASVSESFTRDRLWLNGVEVSDASTSKRFRSCVDGVRRLATDKIDPVTSKVLVRKAQWGEMNVHIASYNTFPTAAGLASSAAGYAALVTALSELFGAKETYPGEMSTIARQGSGSACRSLYGGFVAWRMGGKQDDGSDSIAQQVAPESHWPEIRALIMVVSDAKKGTSSTAGMSTSVATSSLLDYRAKELVSKRMSIIEKAWMERDFQTFGRLTMIDSNQFHAVCLDTFPPIFYMNDVSKNIIQIVHVYNEWAGEIRAAYTFDAGPNAVLYTLEIYTVELGALMLKYFPAYCEKYICNNQFKCKVDAFTLEPSLVEAAERTSIKPCVGDVKKIYFTKSGPGPKTLGPEHAVIDSKTGLNKYKA